MEKLTDAKKTEIILNELIKKYQNYCNCRGNVLFPELRLGSGYNDISERRIDLFMISSEKGNYTTAFEIKVSRADFKKDIENYSKQRGARLYSSNFYYVAPKGMLKPEEIPMWAGLLEYDFESNQFIKKIVAPLQSRNTPSWSLICSIVRKVNSRLYTQQIEELINLNNYYLERIEKAKKLIQEIGQGKYDSDKDLLNCVIYGFLQNTHTQKYDIKRM